MKIMLGILASAALVALAGTGLYLRFGLQVLDRPGMENPAGPMEVNGYPPYVLEERLKIRDAIKEVNPDCKIVLVVDENSEKKVAEEVRRAKKAGRIDQFIYGSISASYLVALMDTL